jgi:transcription elongation factor GreA
MGEIVKSDVATRTGGIVMLATLRQRLNRELDGLVHELTVRIPKQLGEERGAEEYESVVERQRQTRARINVLQNLLAALTGLGPEALPPEGAGFGSEVRIRELSSGSTMTYTLMAGDAIDLEAGEISLASPVGRALLGLKAGDEVEVATPVGRRRFRVISVTPWADALAGAAPATAQYA